MNLAGTLHQNFDARFGLFQLFAAGIAELHAALEQFQGALQRELAAFHFLDDGFQLLKSGLEAEGCVFRRRWLGHE